MASAFKLELATSDGIAVPHAQTEPVFLTRVWFSAQELAGYKLPTMPRDKRKMNELALSQGWAFRSAPDGTALARKRAARGGGIEYHLDVLPLNARAKLVKIVASEAASSDQGVVQDRSAAWQRYDQQSDAAKAEAQRRLSIIDQVDAMVGAGCSIAIAVASLSAPNDVSLATFFNWRAAIKGVEAPDRLAFLVPQRGGGGGQVDVDAEIWRLLISDYLRKSKPAWAACCWRAERKAAEQGLTLPNRRTLWRKFEREVDPMVVVRERDGREALDRMKPAQKRSVEHMHALEMINIDGHRFDVFVEWPGQKEPVRPMMICMSDIYSRKPLAWRFDLSENTHVTRLTFRDLFEKYGIPGACLMDNGRAFNSKQMTGGIDKRNRFKVRAEEPTGILTALGVKVVLATPYHGQAKPIERGFREMCEYISRHPEFQGAYTGSNPMAKPDDYRSRAIPFATFAAVVNREIAALSDKTGRSGGACEGRSWNQTFNDSYGASAIGKATPEQLRMALLASSDLLNTSRSDGSVRLYGNHYWHEELSRRTGEKVRVRFDPEQLHTSVEV